MQGINAVLEKNKFNYESIVEKSDISLLDSKEYDMNVIIGFRGRKEFLEPLINSFKKAFNFYTKKDNTKTFCLTFVEHSLSPDNKDFLRDKVNYLWTPGNTSEQYSRSFAYNFGVKYSNKSKYYILHDLDILVKENFFEEIFQNLKSQCLQTYGKRRVLYMSPELTTQVLSGEVDINTLNENSQGISFPEIFGSKGGSILVERELYYQIGGFDPEIFWGYAPEDQLFWDKVQTILGEVDYADNPPVDIFHMWHPPTLHHSNQEYFPMERCFYEFRFMTKKQRMAFITEKQEIFKDDGKFVETLFKAQLNPVKTFIFTEGYNCGKILKKCLESFFKYHPDTTVHVFGTVKDFKELGKFDNVEYVEMSNDQELKECFKYGHMGTAHIGAKVIKEFSAGYDYIIHFDSDVIFRKESISLLTNKLSEGYDIVGPRRCYKNNQNGLTNLGDLADVSQTYFYAFNKNKISEGYDFNQLRQMIVGYHNPLGHAILDYFDPVSFDILKNGGKIFFLDVDDVGGLTESGSRLNVFKELNQELDFGNNVVHFAGVGSGMKFYEKGADSTSESYVNWAKKRFALYSKVIHDTTLIDIELDVEIANKLIAALNETNNK